MDKEIFTKIFSKIKQTFIKHKKRLDMLETRVKALEEKEQSNPWKMPFD